MIGDGNMYIRFRFIIYKMIKTHMVFSGPKLLDFNK